MGCRGRGANSPARGAYPRVRARPLHKAVSPPKRPARSQDRAAPAPPHGGRFASAGPDAALWIVCASVRAGAGRPYPRIRAVLLTYWRGPGGWLAGTETRTARRGGAYPRIRSVLLTYWFSRADGLPGQRREQHGEGAAYPRIRATPLTYWRGPGGRFAGADTWTPRRRGGLSADKGSTADILARAGRTVCRDRGANSPARGALTRG